MNAEWQYKVFTVDEFINTGNGGTIEDKLNEYGKDGWELAGIMPKKTQSLGNSSKLPEDSVVLKKQLFNLKSNNYN
jgi:Domain of unknown function (DUF4177)